MLLHERIMCLCTTYARVKTKEVSLCQLIEHHMSIWICLPDSVMRYSEGYFY